jgi:L-ascorbate metabolism protein UlaG (beta-lactamase superfamily)
MGDIEITYYGHSCFKVEQDGKSIVFDPYKNGSVPGIVLLDNIEADAVCCSHDHDDHNAASLIHLTGKPDPFPMESVTVPHDHHSGTRRGMCRMTLVHAGKVSILHMGDLGRIPTEEEYRLIRKADIVMIPVGGHFTIDAAEAKTILDTVKPHLAILMHYRNGNRGYEVTADITDIRRQFPSLQELSDHTLGFPEDQIPSGLITLEPLQ